MPTYSTAKLAQVAQDCGGTLSPITLGQLLDEPRQTTASIARALSTTPIWFELALAKPEPVVYAPMTTTNV